jgi:hypothetical protein
MACEVNAIDSAEISATLPDVDDLVWFVLPDGSVVFRKWSTLIQTLNADDIEFQIGVTVGAPAVDTFTYTNAALIGKRIRLFREGAKQSTLGSDPLQRYSFDSLTGTITVNAAWGDEERVSIEQY